MAERQSTGQMGKWLTHDTTAIETSLISLYLGGGAHGSCCCCHGVQCLRNRKEGIKTKEIGHVSVIRHRKVYYVTLCTGKTYLIDYLIGSFDLN